MVQFTGQFDGRTITPDGHVDIPVNVPLRVTIEPGPANPSTDVNWQKLLDLASDCAIDGPADLAEGHDHYAHGKPKE
jgi:hypothetical protein